MAKQQATKEQEDFFRKVIDDLISEGESRINIAKILGISYYMMKGKYFGKHKIFKEDYEKAVRASEYSPEEIRWANAEQRKEFFETVEALSNIGFKKHYLSERLGICKTVFTTYKERDTKISRKMYLDLMELRDELTVQTGVATLDSVMVEYLILFGYSSESLAKELGITVKQLRKIRTETGTTSLRVHNKLYELYSRTLKPMK